MKESKDDDQDELALDQIAPKIISFMKSHSAVGDERDRGAFEDGVSELLDVWMQNWGSIPHADHFLTDALGECLLEAVSLGYRDMVETLLRLGADPDYEETYYQIHQTDGSGDTLIPAYRFPADEFQGLLLGSVEECDFSRRCLHVAVENNDVSMLELLIGFGADVDAREKPQQQTPLHDAARAEERFECLQHLVTMEADINAFDFNGHTALYRTLKVVGNSVQLNLKGAKFLVEKDVNLQGRGHLMKVSRIMAMRSVSHETFVTLCEFVKLLLDHGVRLDDRTVNDDPLLWYCFAHFEKDALGMVSLLLNRGACNPHRHAGDCYTTQLLSHVVPCGTKRWVSEPNEGRQLEAIDCFAHNQNMQQDPAIVNFILIKLATLMNANRMDMNKVDQVLDEAAASLELLISSIDTTKSGSIKWCRNDAWNESWTQVDKIKASSQFSSAIISRFESLASWALRETETQPTSLKNLARHQIRRQILIKRREDVRLRKEEEEEQSRLLAEKERKHANGEEVDVLQDQAGTSNGVNRAETVGNSLESMGGIDSEQNVSEMENHGSDEQTNRNEQNEDNEQTNQNEQNEQANQNEQTAQNEQTDTTPANADDPFSLLREAVATRNDWLQWSPAIYKNFEDDIISLKQLPSYIHGYLLFQCR